MSENAIKRHELLKSHGEFATFLTTTPLHYPKIILNYTTVYCHEREFLSTLSFFECTSRVPRTGVASICAKVLQIEGAVWEVSWPTPRRDVKCSQLVRLRTECVRCYS